MIFHDLFSSQSLWGFFLGIFSSYSYRCWNHRNQRDFWRFSWSMWLVFFKNFLIINNHLRHAYRMQRIFGWLELKTFPGELFGAGWSKREKPGKIRLNKIHLRKTNIAGWKMDPDWVDLFPIVTWGIFQPAMLVYLEGIWTNGVDQMIFHPWPCSARVGGHLNFERVT